MRKSTFILIGILILQISLRAQPQDLVPQIKAIAEEVKARHCPDLRIAIWKIEISTSDTAIVITGETDKAVARAELIQKIKSQYPDLPIAVKITLLPDETLGSKSYGIVINSVETMRSGPSVFKDIVSQTLRGLPVRVLKAEAGYYLIQSDDGYLGWVDDDRIAVGDRAFLDSWQNSAKVVVDRLEAVVYERPSIQSQPVADAILGNRFRVGKKRLGWQEVIFPDGRRGWIWKRFVVAEEDYLKRQPTPETVVKTARQFLGRPYLWGAASPKALDCSGFMQTVFRRHGLLLPRDANMQVRVGTAVDTTSFPQYLQPGDLLFFGARPERITHTGMYIGNGKFIHSSGEVKINSFLQGDPDYSSQLRKNLRAVRRVIKAEGVSK
jgi:SH3-like domain-containing protein